MPECLRAQATLRTVLHDDSSRVAARRQRAGGKKLLALSRHGTTPPCGHPSKEGNCLARALYAREHSALWRGGSLDGECLDENLHGVWGRAGRRRGFKQTYSLRDQNVNDSPNPMIGA